MKAADYMLTAEELRLRQRKRKRLVIGLAITLVLLLAIIFGARPASHQIKAWQARRHASKAFALIDRQQWTDAKSAAIAAYQLRPNEPQAIRAVARFLSRTRQAEALEFWKKLAAETTLTREDLRDQTTVAMIAGENELAQSSLQQLLGKAPEPTDWILAAQLAAAKGAHDELTAALRKIFDNSAATERDQLQAAVLELAAAGGASSPSAAEEERKDGWSRLEKMATGKTDVALEALVILARRLMSTPSPGGTSSVSSTPKEDDTAVVPPTGDTPVTAEATPGSGGAFTLSSADVIRGLENHPLAKAQHKLFALDLRMHDDPGQRAALIEQAVKEWKDADASQLASLAGWLNAKGEYQRELDAIPLEKALQNRDLFLQHVDALGALGRWTEIRDLLNAERFPLEPVVQLMYLARCNAQLGEKTASENNWQRALEAARSEVGKMLVLADYAEKNGAVEIAEAAYNATAAVLPKLRVAQQGRLRIAQAGGDTKKIHTVLAEMLSAWPNDRAIQNDEAYLRLLLQPQRSEDRSQESEPESTPVAGDTPATTEEKENVQRPTSNAQHPTSENQKTDNQQPITDNRPDGEALAAIERLAADLVQREPASLPHRTLLALARLRQNRPAEALQVYADINVPANVLTPSALAVHAAVLAANGNIDDARTEAAQVPVDRLLPEERALIEELLK